MAHIQTQSGIMIDFIEPEIGDIKLEDITHALSMKCRFNGHTSHFYSVARHSLLVADITRHILKKSDVPKDDHADIYFKALIHDFSEAYISDIHSPLKAMLPAYKHIELMLTNKIDSYFRVRYTPDTDWVVHTADRIALIIENNLLLPRPLDESIIDSVPDKYFDLTHKQSFDDYVNKATMENYDREDTMIELEKKVRSLYG